LGRILSSSSACTIPKVDFDFTRFRLLSCWKNHQSRVMTSGCQSPPRIISPVSLHRRPNEPVVGFGAGRLCFVQAETTPTRPSAYSFQYFFLAPSPPRSVASSLSTSSPQPLSHSHPSQPLLPVLISQSCSISYPPSSSLLLFLSLSWSTVTEDCTPSELSESARIRRHARCSTLCPCGPLAVRIRFLF
jgi:hypothetical protein